MSTAVHGSPYISPPPPPYQSLLSQTAHLLLHDGDADTLCQQVFDALREPLELDVYFHYLVSEDGTHLELASSGGNEIVRAALGSRLAFGEAVCGTVAATCQGMHITGVQRRFDAMTGLIRQFGVRCYACNPLIVCGKVVGTFSFGSSQRDSFTEEQQELFRLVVQQVTLATDRRMQSEELRKMERLAAAGRMSAALAHEINNPLETLSTILYVLRDEVRTVEAQTLLHKAEAQVARLAETAHRTLDLFRGKHTKPHPVNLSDLANELAAEIRLPQLVRLRSDIEPQLCVNAIPGELRQVLFNLLINAAQFSPTGEEVTLTVRRLGANAEVRIRDQGKGIDQETAAHLFQPFYTTRGEGGTGLGLFLSREMLGRIGGSLTFESAPQLRRGTEFIVKLPLTN